VIPIAVFTRIDTGTASSSPFQRTPKNVHDHDGIVFTFKWNPRSRCAGNREHDRAEYALIIEAAPPRSLLALLATLKPLDEKFPSIPDEIPDEVNM